MRKTILRRCSTLLAGICLLLTACGAPDTDDGTASALGGGKSTAWSITDGTSAGGAYETDGSIATSSSGSTTPFSSAAAPDDTATTGAIKEPPHAAATKGDTATTKAQGNTGSGSAGKNAAESLLNAAALQPMRTGCAALDKKVDEIFAQIFQSGMSTYDKVKASFDYLVENGIYTQNIMVGDPAEGILYDSALDANIVALAYGILSTNRGVCDHYSAAFVVMTRAIGLESYFVAGQVRSKGGGYTGHAWVNIRINGTYYVFDPQVQQNNAGTPDYFFCKTDAQMGDMYQYDNRETLISQFHSFQHYPEISATVTVRSGGKTYQASLSQSGQAGGNGALPDEIPVSGDGSFSIDVAPAGGTGQYLCQIGYFWEPGHYVEEALTGSKSYTLQVEPGVTAIQIAIEGNDPDLPTLGAVIFEFKAAYTQG